MSLIENVLSAVSVAIPSYNVIPYKISGKSRILICILLILIDWYGYRKMGIYVNLIALPLTYILIAAASKENKIVNLYVALMGYMLTATLNNIAVVGLRFLGLDVFHISKNYSILFQMVYFLVAYILSHEIGKKIKQYRNKIDLHTRMYKIKKVKQIATSYILTCFVIYQVGIIIEAEQGHSTEILIANSLIMGAIFVGAISIPAYVMIILQKELSKKEEALSKIGALYNICESMSMEEIEKIKNETIKQCEQNENIKGAEFTKKLFESIEYSKK